MKSNIRLANTQQEDTRRVNRLLAEIRARKPTEVVIWYNIAGEECGVRTSKLTDRTKTVGALAVAAIDVWDAE